MKEIKSWQIVIILFFLIQTAFGQETGFIATDSSKNTGVNLIEGTSRDNSQFILLKKYDGEIRYFPEQLTEYGFKNGTVYLSKNISVSDRKKRVFLERLEYGKITLYFYTEKGIKTFFLEKDSSVFVEVHRDDNFRKLIAEYTSDFEWKANQVQQVNYNRKSLSRLISMYNHNLNRSQPFPRFGIIAGYNATLMKIPSTMSNERLEDISFKPSSSAAFGVFVDFPIEMSDFSFNGGVNFSKSDFSVNSKTAESDIDVIVNISSLNVPLLLRYTLPILVWRPFANFGGVYSYHLKNETGSYETFIDQIGMTTKYQIGEGGIVANNMFGYSVGAGLQRNLNNRKIVSIELRYNQLYANKDTLDKNQFQILTSFSF